MSVVTKAGDGAKQDALDEEIAPLALEELVPCKRAQRVNGHASVRYYDRRAFTPSAREIVERSDEPGSRSVR